MCRQAEILERLPPASPATTAALMKALANDDDGAPPEAAATAATRGSPSKRTMAAIRRALAEKPAPSSPAGETLAGLRREMQRLTPSARGRPTRASASASTAAAPFFSALRPSTWPAATLPSQLSTARGMAMAGAVVMCLAVLLEVGASRAGTVPPAPPLSPGLPHFLAAVGAQVGPWAANASAALGASTLGARQGLMAALGAHADLVGRAGKNASVVLGRAARVGGAALGNATRDAGAALGNATREAGAALSIVTRDAGAALGDVTARSSARAQQWLRAKMRGREVVP